MKLTIYLHDAFQESRSRLVYPVADKPAAEKLVQAIQTEGVWINDRYWTPAAFCYADLETK